MPKRKAPSSPSPEKATNVQVAKNYHGADTFPSSSNDEPDSNASQEAKTSNPIGPCTGHNGSASTASTSKDPPPYGSQEYWEKRYSVLKAPGSRGDYEGNGTQDDAEVNALPGHAWYFTYDELRPLILPLLLGRDVSPAAFLTEREDEEECEYEDNEEDDNEEDGGEVIEGNMHNGREGSVDNNQEHEDKVAETEIDTLGLCQDDQPPHPPKSVLEIGCGDVPLGYSLFLDLLSMEKETQADASLVVSRIVCNDYAKTVVDVLRDRQKKRWLASGVKGSYNTVDGRDGMKEEYVVIDPDFLGPPQEHCKGAILSKLDVSYVVEDARKMPHKDESFDLIIDKGTMDALLSDRDLGVKNCVDVMSEMARVLSTGGYIMIVSHMNANIQSGLEWCEEIVVAGLRASGAKARWEIEIHGNDGSSNDDIDDDDAFDEETEKSNGEAADKGPPSGSPGPACYIIHKMSSQQKTANACARKDGPGSVEQFVIPLKFYSY